MTQRINEVVHIKNILKGTTSQIINVKQKGSQRISQKPKGYTYDQPRRKSYQALVQLR